MKSAVSDAVSESASGPARVTRLLGEARWLVFATGAFFLALILATYQRDDPSWSHNTAGGVVRNAGGYVGARVADMLLSAFGFSAWWLVALLIYLVIAAYRRLGAAVLAAGAAGAAGAARAVSAAGATGTGGAGGADGTVGTVGTIGTTGTSAAKGATGDYQAGTTLLDRRSLFAVLGGFALLLGCSTALENLRLYSLKVQLPQVAGGMLGDAAGRFAESWFGFTGSTLLLLLGAAVGFSLFTGVSWLTVAEKTGAACEWVFERIKGRMEERRDRQAGVVAQEVREQVVEEERRDLFEDHSAIRIEPPVIEVPQSPRAEKEKQAPLFADLPDTGLPPLLLLDAASESVETVSAETIEFTSRLIEKKLKDFNVQAEVKAAYPGPVITRYEIEPATGVKGSQIVGLAKDLARALSLVSVRVVETIPGKSLMGLELPNPKRQIVRLSEICGSQVYNDNPSALTIAMGKDIAGKPVIADLAKMPHLLVAGTTGSGKSVAINAIILSLLYKAEPKDVRLILIDPKMLEMSVYADIPHLLAPVVTDMKQAANALNWCVGEMERRYRLLSSLGVRNLAGYNSKITEGIKTGKPHTNPFSLTPDAPEPLDHLPMIVVIIDELADLMMVAGKKIEELIARLAQKARAAGIHLILATQRPSVDVITGLIKANIPTRISFQVSSKIDSRTILDQMGAESLLGQGDMLFLPPGSGLPQRVHGAFVSDEEVHKVVNHLKTLGAANYIEGILEGGVLEGEEGAAAAEGGADAESDPLYDQAVEVVLKNKRASISLVQRHLRIGYNRAARLLEGMEKAGLVSSMQGNGNRDILAPARAE